MVLWPRFHNPVPGRRSWPIIVGGCHRSGTSLVRRVLDAHSRIHCGPEVKFFRDFYGDFPDDALGPFRFFATARSILAETELFAITGEAFVRMHERAAAAVGKVRWADKCPENVLYLDQWERLLGEKWLFVHVVRNPLDTLASMKEAVFPRTLPPDVAGRAAFWARYTRAGLAFGAAHPDRSYVLQYESLVADPNVTLAALMAWVGEQMEPMQLDFNRMQHQPGLEDPKVAGTTAIHSDSVGRWSMQLTPEEIACIQEQCGPLWQELTAGVR